MVLNHEERLKYMLRLTWITFIIIQYKPFEIQHKYLVRLSVISIPVTTITKL